MVATVRRLINAAALVLLATACRDGIPLFESPAPASAHARYARGLERAGLEKTALARDWLSVAESSIRKPLAVSLPFKEAGYFASSEARAVGYAVRLRDGQRLSVVAETTGQPLAIFLDLFEQTGDSAKPLDLVASMDTTIAPARARLEHEARRDGVYVLRVQPELLRSGGYTITASTEPSLAFPVSGKDSRAVKSFFGADRDAGARQHHGIDIFASRGTPVLAAARGTVRSVSPNNLGGNVVWLSDYARGQTLYYAHLDRHNVTAGQQVEIGDTLGFVGNTGNARTTPPHLHFGVYRRGQGPLDPYPFVYRSAARPAAITADTTELGTLARSRARAPVVASLDRDALTVAMIDAATPLRVDGAAGSWFRVRLPDGTAGYVASRYVEPTRRAVRQATVASGTPLRDRPSPDAGVIATSSGGALPVIGQFADYALVDAGEGRTAWVPVRPAETSGRPATR
ncbi:MAG TPA: peptidoglycan DD-metalloendopeptidase family protein [Gemmatimonadaceae bacterium]|nr:peptidoglycan DD-metalloendopeptidase family protein [Gemmatimonadaceae bacterium]